jgi:hypothetical protein
MSNDDPTKVIGDNMPATPPTQPTIETVLQRINELGETLRAEISELRIGQETIIEQLSQLNSKIDVLNDEMLNLKAEQKRHGKRIDGLERKAS